MHGVAHAHDDEALSQVGPLNGEAARPTVLDLVKRTKRKHVEGKLTRVRRRGSAVLVRALEVIGRRDFRDHAERRPEFDW